jgi:2-hydroxy fatty acid dioxygenase
VIFEAFVLAPFFIHLEVLFAFGYRPKLHETLTNVIGTEIARFRKEEGDRNRASKNTWINEWFHEFFLV